MSRIGFYNLVDRKVDEIIDMIGPLPLSFWDIHRRRQLGAILEELLEQCREDMKR